MKYEEKFEMMANRGQPIGPIALLDRVQAPPAAAHTAQGRRFRGLAVAMATFVVVLVGGLLLGWFRAPLEFIGGDDSSIEWIEMTEPAFVVAGPGGLIRITYRAESNGPIIEFSDDARSWAPTEGLSFDTRMGVREVVATSTTWLLVASDNTTMAARASSDGITWFDVVFPDALNDAFESIAGSPGGFMATAYDVFGVGSTVWWSADGINWAEATDTFPGDPQAGRLLSSEGGIVWRSYDRPDQSSPVTLFMTTDGTNWIEMRIPSSSSSSGVGSEIDLQLIEYVGNQWIAFGQVYRVDADPELVVWTSPDGIGWTSQVHPPFGKEPGHAVEVSLGWLVGRNSLVSGSLLLAPWTIPVSGGVGETRRENGSATGTGELWMTSDGRTWHRELNISGMIDSYAATVTDDGSLAGLWARVPESDPVADAPDDTSASVATTIQFQPSPQDLDPAGQALQDAILADGVVTREEFEQAAEGWKTCMQEFGFPDADYEIHASGGWSRGWSTDPYEGESEDALCDANYVTRVLDGVNP